MNLVLTRALMVRKLLPGFQTLDATFEDPHLRTVKAFPNKKAANHGGNEPERQENE